MQADPARDRFWQWFRSNADRVRDLLYGKDDAARKRASDELGAAVRQVQEGVILEMGPLAADGRRQLIVSADGRPENVESVKEFVASAPEVPGWEVVAFRPRMNVHDAVEIQLEDQRVGADDIWFRVEPNDDGLALTLFVRGLTDANRRLRGLGASLLAEHAVGERDALTMLTGLDVEPLPDDPAAEGLRPFPDLVGVFDRAKAEKYPPPGELPLAPEGEWLSARGTINGAFALILLNTGLRGVAGHPDYDRRLTVSIPFNQKRPDGMPASNDEYDAVQEIGERLGEALRADQQSLLAIVMMTQGRREMIFYTSDAQAAVARLREAAEGVESHQIKARSERDTFWGMYRHFCQGASKAKEEE